MFNGQRFCIEIMAAFISAAVLVLTLVEPTWFELLFDEAPDGGDGSLESVVAIITSLFATFLCIRMAWREWRCRPAAIAGRTS